MRPISQENEKSSTQSGDKIVPHSVSSSSSKPKDSKNIVVTIHFLDDSVATFKVQSKSLGKWLFAQVCEALNLNEVDYFGLKYFDSNGTGYWLEAQKPLNRQLSMDLKDAHMHLRVKFYILDPNLLEEELTWYLFSLQIRKDLTDGSFHCDENMASIMAAYIIQAEIGDYHVDQHEGTNYVAKFNLVPQQTPAFEKMVMDLHRKLEGQSPAEADFNLIETASKSEYYGIKLTAAKNIEGRPVSLAVDHSGISVFKKLIKVSMFSWTQIRKLSFKRKRFYVKLHDDLKSSNQPIVEFIFTSRDECKNFWKKCVEQHTFFRCCEAKNIEKVKKKIFTRGSSFRYVGRTQQQLAETVHQHRAKGNSFERPKRSHKKDFSEEKSVHEPSSISTNTSANEAIISNVSLPGKINLIDSSMQERPRSITPTTFQSPVRTPRKMSYQSPMPPDLLCDTFYARKRRNTIEGNIDSPMVMIDILGDNQPSPSYEKTKTDEPKELEPSHFAPESFPSIESNIEDSKPLIDFGDPIPEDKTKPDIKPKPEELPIEGPKDEPKPIPEPELKSEIVSGVKSEPIPKIKLEQVKSESFSGVEKSNSKPEEISTEKNQETVPDKIINRDTVEKVVKKVERKSHSSERSSSRCENKPAIPQKPEKLVREARERRTPDHQSKVPQTAEHSRRSSQKRVTRMKERRATSAPRSRDDANYFHDFRVRSNSKPNRILFAQIKPLIKPGQSNPKSQSNLSCISVHSLPGLESYSYRDDTLDDPLDELLNRRLQTLLNDPLSNKTTSAVELGANGSNGDLKSSKSSFHHLDEDRSCESLDQWASDSQDFESDFGSVDISSVQNETLDRVSELNKMIIDSYLKAHFPDDLIIDSLINANETKLNGNQCEPTSKQLINFDQKLKPSDYSNQLLTVDEIVMQRNLQIFTCY